MRAPLLSFFSGPLRRSGPEKLRFYRSKAVKRSSKNERSGARTNFWSGAKERENEKIDGAERSLSGPLHSAQTPQIRGMGVVNCVGRIFGTVCPYFLMYHVISSA